MTDLIKKYKDLRKWCELRKTIVGLDGKKYIDIFCEVYDYAVGLIEEIDCLQKSLDNYLVGADDE